MTRFIITSRKRPEMDLQNYLDSYELSFAPRFMFSSDSQFLLGSDKATMMYKVETLVQSSIENDQYVILFGMAVVNPLKLGQSIINCEQFAEAFFRIAQGESSHAEDVRVIFDQYINHSSKRSTVKKRKTKILLCSTKYGIIHP